MPEGALKIGGEVAYSIGRGSLLNYVTFHSIIYIFYSKCDFSHVANRYFQFWLWLTAAVLLKLNWRRTIPSNCGRARTSPLMSDSMLCHIEDGGALGVNLPRVPVDLPLSPKRISRTWTSVPSKVLTWFSPHSSVRCCTYRNSLEGLLCNGQEKSFSTVLGT